MLYRTLDEMVEGVVITFFNISDLKEAELKLNENEQINKLLLNSASDIFIKLSTDWNILEINPAAEKFFGKKLEQLMNKNYFHTFIPESLRKKTEKELNKMLGESRGTRIKMEVITAAEKPVEVDSSVIVLRNNNKVPTGIILSIKK
jgi:two-component system CheB/CheR fusion protein